jgi:hypothetical protein
MDAQRAQELRGISFASMAAEDALVNHTALQYN